MADLGFIVATATQHATTTGVPPNPSLLAATGTTRHSCHAASIVMRMAPQAEEAEAAALTLVQETVSGEMASTRQALRTHVWSVNCSV